jgi:hypothetical protein
MSICTIRLCKYVNNVRSHAGANVSLYISWDIWLAFKGGGAGLGVRERERTVGGGGEESSHSSRSDR